ncbi:hypothetical protein EJB05_34810, partial [Eragrostis curvula]
MVEMIVGHQVFGSPELKRLLEAYMSLNASTPASSRAGTSTRSNLCNPKTDLRNGKDWREESRASYMR